MRTEKNIFTGSLGNNMNEDKERRTYRESPERKGKGRIYSPDSDEKNEVLERNLEEVSKSITQMRILFNSVHQGRRDTEFLYNKGIELKSKLEEEVGVLPESEEFEDLKEAFEFIGDLHDEDTRRYHQGNKERVYYHLRRLSRY